MSDYDSRIEEGVKAVLKKREEEAEEANVTARIGLAALMGFLVLLVRTSDIAIALYGHSQNLFLQIIGGAVVGAFLPELFILIIIVAVVLVFASAR